MNRSLLGVLCLCSWLGAQDPSPAVGRRLPGQPVGAALPKSPVQGSSTGRAQPKGKLPPQDPTPAPGRGSAPDNAPVPGKGSAPPIATPQGKGGTPPKPKAQSASDATTTQTIRYDDSSGWPIVPGEVRPPLPTPAASSAPAAAPAGETANVRSADRSNPRSPGVTPSLGNAAGRRSDGARSELASGMALGSPLLDVFQATHAPGAFRDLGGIVVWWRVTTHGPRGEVIGTREVTQTADCAFSERDRLEYVDGRTFGRIGAQVYAEKQGMPAPTLIDTAQWELTLFGTQLRMPWLFGDAKAFAVVARDVDDLDGERMARVVVERRPPPALDTVGPDFDPAPRDRYELLYEPSSGLPRRFVHRFAASKQTRTVLLEDWRDVEGVRMPFRRVYVDDSMRSTTVLEIQRVERQRVTERDFRLH